MYYKDTEVAGNCNVFNDHQSLSRIIDARRGTGRLPIKKEASGSEIGRDEETLTRDLVELITGGRPCPRRSSTRYWRSSGRNVNLVVHWIAQELARLGPTHQSM